MVYDKKSIVFMLLGGPGALFKESKNIQILKLNPFQIQNNGLWLK